METINDLPDKTFWQSEAKIKANLKELGIKAVKELERKHRYDASKCIRRIFNIKESDTNIGGSEWNQNQ